MSIYIIKFRQYDDEVKIGKSVKIMSRLQDHIKDHGPIEWVEEYVGGDDKVAERLLLEEFRTCRPGQIPRHKAARKGWTEFIPESSSCAAGLRLQSIGYSKTTLSVTDVGNNKRRVGKAFKYQTTIDELTVLDAVILTPLLFNEKFPNSFEDFNAMCEKHGEPNNWCNASVFTLAQQMHARFPRGILQNQL